ncbi:MAG: hypothetical protein CVV51_02200 [Spirochaetae bacterium HGW-Spirochaetae-7]|jgi:hypothetical protein|nr:MAG: hypothetical protein CVV51_02200 [Spirochaetae bacterium HGW-Spirochaetae-7]
MIEALEVPVLTLVDRIDAIERETESMYLRLGRVFQSVKGAVDASSREAETAIRAVLHEHHSGSSVEAAQRRSVEFIEDATRFFEKASRTEQEFMHGIESGIESLSMLDGIIDRIRDDSEEMEIVSLNAMTVALKSGAAGRAFSVITDELKQLSGRTIRHADDLSRAGQVLLERLGTLRGALEALSATQSSFFDSAKTALESGFAALDRQVDETACAIRGLGDGASSVREPIATIMQEVQLQDIIRQSLDHVRLSLQAAEPEGVASSAEAVDPAEEAAFLGEITKLSASLLDDVAGQVHSSLERFRSGMEGVSAVMTSVEAGRKAIVDGRLVAGPTEDYEAKARAFIVAKESAAIDATAISEDVRGLESRFREMQSILARFKSIVTASRIETARNKALAVVSTTVIGMMELTERLTEDVAAAGGVTRSFGKTLSTGMSDYLSGAEESLETLRTETAKLQSEFVRIEESRRRMWKAESDFRPFSGRFAASFSEAMDSVASVESLAQELESMRDALVSCTGASAQREHQASTIHSERLRAIVDRFTIFAHKQTAARITNFDSSGDAVGDASSAESGDVTLF